MTPAEASARSGLAALQRGDAAAGRTAFEQAIAGGFGPPAVQLLLAQACRILGDEGGEKGALERVLEAEPANIRALVMRGDTYTRAGDVRAATTFYKAAVSAARAAGGAPPELQPDIRHASEMIAAAGGDYQAHLERSLAGAGVDLDAASPRFREAVDILFGRKQVFLQQPGTFYYPRLPHIQFYEREDFAWAAGIEAATAEIRAELLGVLEEEGAFEPYVQAAADRPHFDFHGMLGDPSWSAFYLVDNGRRIEENIARCPRTMEALAAAPLTEMPNRAPSILFSLLRPGAHIPPHNGMLNTRLICHLPLIVPPGCALRVGNETREWETGKLLIFDDSIEHEAWNRSSELRVVLLFDVWRPELSAEERQAIAAIFGAIDAFRGPEAGG